jgi:hypothetical protein
MSDIYSTIQLAIGVLFLLSFGGKVQKPIAFARGVAQYDILPPRPALVFGLILIPGEAFVAFAHLTGWLLPAALPLGVAMLLSFAIAVGTNLARGRGVQCHCFGTVGGEFISARSLGRLLMMIFGEVILLAAIYSQPLPSRPAPIRSVGEVVISLPPVVCVLLSAMWVLRLPDVINLFRSTLTARDEWSRSNSGALS